MSKDKEQFEKIAAYLAGESSDQEKKNIDDWRKSSAENESIFKEAESIWKHSTVKLQYDGNADEDWKDLDQALQSEKVIPFWNTTLFKVAATFILLAVALIPLVLNKSEDTTTTSAEAKVIASYSASDMVQTINLPDSTTVWLNKKGTLELYEGYGTTERLARLNGEAFFRVKRNTSVPFIVYTDNSITKVVGTSFNIRESNDTTAIMVAEGRVRFSAADTTGDKSIIVNKHEGANVNSRGTTQAFKADPKQIGSWRKVNNVSFENERKSPASFIHTDFKWYKNTINQSVIRGTIKSSSVLAEYKNIVLRLSYKKPNGKTVHSTIKVAGPLPAAGEISFEKRLLDLFTDTRDVKVEVQKADVQ